MKDSLNILVAEKERIEGAYICSMLEKNGWTAAWVSSGVEVMEQVATGTYQALVISTSLAGGTDGAAVVAQVQAWLGDNQLEMAVIGLANTSLAAEQQRLVQAGVDKSLTKPIYQRSLSQALNESCTPLQGNVSVA